MKLTRSVCALGVLFSATSCSSASTSAFGDAGDAALVLILPGDSGGDRTATRGDGAPSDVARSHTGRPDGAVGDAGLGDATSRAHDSAGAHADSGVDAGSGTPTTLTPGASMLSLSV